MGRVFLVGRLAARDVRHHLPQALLLVVAIAAATTTLTMALALSGVTKQPYQQTRAATKGPDVVVYLTVPSEAGPGAPASPGPTVRSPAGATATINYSAEARAVIHTQGVVASSGPYPVIGAVLRVDGRTAGAEVEGRLHGPAAVDQPKLTSGTWVRHGGVVFERTFAEALGVDVGSKVTLAGRPFTVAGIAVTAAQSPYPNLCYDSPGACGPILRSVFLAGIGPRNTGLVWMDEPDVRLLSSRSNPIDNYVLNLKLRDPTDAPAFVNHLRYPAMAWENLRLTAGLLVQDAQSVLAPGSILLALLAIASVAVLVGRRLSEYARRVGLLKAVGGTPTLIATTFLIENVVLALFAAAVGFGVGWLTAPSLTDPGAALIGTPGPPALTVISAIEVLGVALAVALAATLVPAIRAAHTSTVRALADVGRPSRRRGVLVRFSRRLPVPMLFGLRLVARRPRRALLSTAIMAVTVTGLVVVVCFHATVTSKLSGAATSGLIATGISDPVVNRDLQMLGVITVMLVTLALLNTIFTTWGTVLDARRASAVMRALGTPARQVSLGLIVAQVLSAIPGTLIGVGLGIELFKAAVKSSGAPPPVLWLLITVLGTLAVVAGLTMIPARLGSRESIAEVLASETA
jgi:putative ABC transport system permease protein